MKNTSLLCGLYQVIGIVSCITLAGLTACKTHTKEEPLPVQEKSPAPPPPVKEIEPVPMEQVPKEPYVTDWRNTTWIIRDSIDTTAKTWPGYKGFHLAPDGNLMLINMDAAIGNRWQGNDNTLTLKLLKGSPDFPLEGTFHTYQIDTPGNSIEWMRLVPDAMPASNGMVFEKASIAIDIIENHWIPRNLSNSEGIRWPMGKDIHLLLLPNGMGGINAIGYGGVNRYDGPAYISTGQISINPLPITGKTGEDTNFENLFFQRLQEASHFVQVEKDMFFYKTTVPLAAFNAQLFN